MNSFISKISLPARLMLIALLPIVFFIYLGLQVYQEKTERIEILNDYLIGIKKSFIRIAVLK